MKKSSKTMGQRLHDLRLQKHLTQEQMGEKLSLSTSAYCKIEYGETDLTLTRLFQIAGVLGMTPLELFKALCGESRPQADSEVAELRQAVKRNERTIEQLCRRIEALELKLQG